MPTVLISGGTGFIGNHLVPLLQKEGYTIHIFTRKKDDAPEKDGIKYFTWNPQTGEYDPKAFDGVDCLLSLAGTGIADKRWTEKYKKEIITSRVESIQLLVKAMQETPNTVQTVINASAIGWYGPDTETSIAKGGFTENDPAADTYIGHVCQQWEAAAQLFAALNKRLVIFRIGIVMHPDGGMLKELLSPMKFGIAPVLGKRNRIISWIRLNDLCRMFIFAFGNKNMEGVYNAVTATITNKELVNAIVKSRKGLCIKMPVPAFALRMIVGEVSEELLRSVTVNGNKIAAMGFTFKYPEIKDAVAAG